MSSNLFHRPFGLLSLLLATLTAPTIANAQTAGAPPPTVIVAPVKTADISGSIDFSGTVEAIQSVDLKARVTGFLEAVKFQEGGLVKKGDLLYAIEKAPYQANLASAEGQLSAAQATLAGAQAALANAQAALDRQTTLLQKGTVTQAAADLAKATRDESSAKVQSAQAAIKQANAQVELANLNLSYTEIATPIDGRIGATTLTVGNLVTPGSDTLATVVQIDPIRVVFSVPESDYVNFVEQKGTLNQPDNQEFFTPRLTLSNRKSYGQDGKISFVNNQVSSTTGTLQFYAEFPNPDGLLLPGAFVSVDVNQSQAVKLPVVPASAILQDKEGLYVFVLDADNKAQQRRIETSARVGQDYAVTSGLQAGETVIVEGVQKVIPGAEVTPQTLPESSPSATTETSTSPPPAQSSDSKPATGGN